METYFDGSSVLGDVFKTTFTLLNDVNRRSVSILSKPTNLRIGKDGWMLYRKVDGTYVPLQEGERLDESETYYDGNHIEYNVYAKLNTMHDATDSRECVYIVGGTSIRYSFRSVGESPKFVIGKMFSDYHIQSSNSEGLEIYLNLQDEDEKRTAEIEYRGHGEFCVYGDIASRNRDYSAELSYRT